MAPTILITRPDGTAQVFEDQLRAKLGTDASIVTSPLLTIVYAKAAPDLDGINTLIFTSAHAVRAFCSLTERRNFTCYTVGPATAGVAKREGFRTTSGPGTAGALGRKIIADAPKQNCLYLRGNHVAYDLEPVLNQEGITTHSSVIYRQVDQMLSSEARNLLQKNGRVILPLFSPRSATVLFDSVDTGADIYLAAMSTAVAQSVPMAKVAHLDVAERPDLKSMVEVTIRLWRRAYQLEGKGPAQ